MLTDVLFVSSEGDYVGGSDEQALVVHDVEQGAFTLGAPAPAAKDRSSRRFSFNLDYANIYGSNRNSTSSARLEPAKDTCCVIS